LQAGYQVVYDNVMTFVRAFFLLGSGWMLVIWRRNLRMAGKP